MKLYYHLILICISIETGGDSFRRSCAMKFNKLRDHVIYITYVNDKWKYNKWLITNHVTYSCGTILFSCLFQPSLVIVTFVKAVVFLICHVITWSKVTSNNGWIPFHRSQQIWSVMLTYSSLPNRRDVTAIIFLRIFHPQLCYFSHHLY